MARPPARQSPGCAIVLVLLLGAPAAYLLYASLFGVTSGPTTRIWQAVGAAVLLVAVVAGLLVVLDVGDGKRPGYAYGCLPIGLLLLTGPGLLLALLGPGGVVAVVGWILAGAGVLVMFGTVLNRGGPDGADKSAEPSPAQPSRDESGPADSSSADSAPAASALSSSPNGRVSALPTPAEPGKPVSAANRIGCTLAAVGLLALPGLTLLWLAAFDPTRSPGGRVWCAIGGALLLALAAAATTGALGLGDSARRLDLGCLGLVLVLLIAPGVLLLIAANPPTGVRIVGWCLLGAAALALLGTATRSRLDRSGK